MRTGSSKSNILRHLLNGNKLTALEALELFQTMNLRTRICELRAEGYGISDEWVTLPNKKRIKRYFIN